MNDRPKHLNVARSGRAAVHFVLIALFFWVVAAKQAHAQDAPLVVPFTHMPPFLTTDRAGNRTGFSVALAETIAKSLDLPLTFRDLDHPAALHTARNSGAVDLFVGAQVDPAAQTPHSVPVATTTLRPAVRADRLRDLQDRSAADLRVGVVPGVTPDRLIRGDQATFATPTDAVIALLGNRVETVLLPQQIVYAITRDIGLDGQIAFLDSPALEIRHAVTLSTNRADLVTAITETIEALEDSGQLQALRNQYFLTALPAQPETLTIGIADLPPLSMRDANGNPTGFNVEVTQALAEAIGVDVQFEFLDLARWVQGPAAGGVDITAAIVITDERRAAMDFTLPILERNIAVVSRIDDPGAYRRLTDLAEAKVGVIAGSVFEDRARAAGLAPLTYPTNAAILDAKDKGEIDLSLFPSRIAKEALQQADATDRYQAIPLADERIDTALALRPGLGPLREQLNAVIPDFVLSETYSNLRETYLEDPPFWTPRRLRLTLMAVAVPVALIIAGLIAQTLLTRARAMRAVSAVKNELEAIFEATNSGICAFDRSGMITRINQRARDFLGEIDAAVPFRWPETIRFLDAQGGQVLPPAANPINRAVKGAALQNRLYLMQGSDNDAAPRYVRVQNAPLTDQSADIQTVVVFDDVTEEEHKRQRAEQKNRLEALGQFTGGIAHDFNNHLTTLLTSVFLARRATTTDKRAKHLKTAEDTVSRARALTTRLTSFAKRAPAQPESMRVAALLDSIEDLVRPMLEASITLRSAVTEPDLLVFCERAEVESAVLNLVLNSRAALLRSGQGDQILLQARAAPPPETIDATAAALRYVEITVSDNGPGMDAATLARATEPFFTTSATDSGTGLGLSMVAGFAERAGGALTLYAEENMGTTVRLTLPRGTADGLREAPVEPDAITLGQGEIILLVEDDPEILSSTEALLTDIGYRVETASNGTEAVAMVEDGLTFDVLLTDVVMPGSLTGFELAEAIRQQRPKLPVVFVSGYTGFAGDATENPPGPLLQKPTAPAEMAHAIADALQRKPPLG